jgi:ribosomal protein L11 methylase PrmA
VFRSIMPSAAEDFAFVESTGLLSDLVADNKLVPFSDVDPDILADAAPGAVRVLEHPRLPLVTYPYEWPFPALKAAALLQLDVQLLSLERGVNLSDATAYNIQFQGPNPIFIDHLSFRPYKEGEYWAAHSQFCEQFLNPLLLRSIRGIPHNAWYRGRMDGIAVADLNSLLPLRSKFSLNVLQHVVLQARFQKSSSTGKAASTAATRQLPLSALKQMLQSMRNWIEKLRPADTGETVWQNYANQHSYRDDEVKQKEAFIADFVTSNTPSMVWDIGCNTGDYLKVALNAGATAAIGFDFDQGALEHAFARAREEKLNLTPLFLDATNPAPNQGWAEEERKGMAARKAADGVMALAVVHHLAITRNIPLDRVVGWLMDMAPVGVIEFVPKQDAMVQELLRLREDIFPDYTAECFLAHIEARGKVVRQQTVSESGRLLVMFENN